MRENDVDSDAEWLTVKQAMLAFGEPVSQQTLSHWMNRGVLNRHTQIRVILHSRKIGGQIRIQRAWISKFIEETNLR